MVPTGQEPRVNLQIIFMALKAECFVNSSAEVKLRPLKCVYTYIYSPHIVFLKEAEQFRRCKSPAKIAGTFHQSHQIAHPV